MTARSIDWVAQQVRAERAAAGLTQQELAERAAVSISTVRRLEKHGDSDMEVLIAICDALQLRAHEFFARAQERRSDIPPTHATARSPALNESVPPLTDRIDRGDT